jgi:dimethylamine monooxygenase subunit A
MDFDLRQIPVPFRMQPGLRRLAPGAPQLTPLDPSGDLYREKRSVFDAGQSRHALPGFDSAPALAAITAAAAHLGCASGEGQLPLELAFEEDFAVLDGATGIVPWLCVCVPSHWTPEDKLGLDFAALHRPVADSAALIAASQQLVALATSGDCWERFVWNISPSGRYGQHPRRHLRTPWPTTEDPRDFAQQCWLGAERQTFLPVGQGTRQAVFTIRVMLQPLVDAVRPSGNARRLHDSLATMSQAVLEYKNLGDAREPLLRWLASQAQT